MTKDGMDEKTYDWFMRAVDDLNQVQARLLQEPITDEMSRRSRLAASEIVSYISEEELDKRDVFGGYIQPGRLFSLFLNFYNKVCQDNERSDIMVEQELIDSDAAEYAGYALDLTLNQLRNERLERLTRINAGRHKQPRRLWHS